MLRLTLCIAVLCLALLLGALPVEAWADRQNSHHGNPFSKMEHIQVLGKSFSHSELFEKAPAITSISGDELFRKSESSLGDTLRKEPGVNATQFGPHASRPVIRGLGGDRIRILQNGIGVLDASGSSEDHAVPLSPMAVDSIEVVRGPISLLYGASAIGGVVNITNSRIHRHYDEGFYGGVDVKGDSVNSGQRYAGKVDYGVNSWMFHLDGDYGKTENLKVPGDLDTILNSDNEQHSASVGVTKFSQGEDAYGISVSRFENNYGVVAEEDVRIQLNQTRVDARGQIWLDGFFEDIKIQSAQSFYDHTEFEGQEVGTTFDTTGNETRLELHQKESSGWSGLLGMQWTQFDFSAKGDEAFLPISKNQAGALFAFQEIQLGAVTTSLGLRGEWSQVAGEAGPVLAQAQDKDFFSSSAALAAVYEMPSHWFLGSQLSYSQRAPSFQELFSNGAHVATGTFEVGRLDLDLERSLALELSLRKREKSYQGSLSLFAHQFENYIALNPTGGMDDTDESGIAGDSPEDFPIFNYQQQGAEFWGAELDVLKHIPMQSLGTTHLRFTFDILRGRDRDRGFALARISPFRAHMEWSHDLGAIGANLGVEYVGRPTNLAPNEAVTKAYTLVNLGISYKLSAAKSSWALFLSGKNLFDREARNHISLLKDRVLLPGRNVSLGLRGYF